MNAADPEYPRAARGLVDSHVSELGVLGIAIHIWRVCKQYGVGRLMSELAVNLIAKYTRDVTAVGKASVSEHPMRGVGDNYIAGDRLIVVHDTNECILRLAG